MATASAGRSETTRTIAADIRRYGAASSRLEQVAADEAGLTLSTCEANFVHLLQLHGPLTAGLLGQLTEGTSSATTTGVIDRLEKAGYVERTRSTADRRKVIVSLRAERFESDDAIREQRLAGVLADFDDTQLTVIADFLAGLADAESRAATPAGFTPPPS